jgi:hypothetical protein
MPNRKVLEAASERREKMRPQAERTYRKYGARVHDLIRQLGSPTQEDHDYAFNRLSRMGEFVASELLEALADPALDPVAADEVVSLLGTTGDERAPEAVWQFLQAHQDDSKRVSTAALSLASLGDDRALPYLREYLDADDEELVSDSVAGLIMVGQMEDIPHLRQVHLCHRANREIRFEVANAVLTILGGTDQRTFNRTLDEIRTSFTDRHLWADIWTILESQFGDTSQYTVH